jgi:hypothetical protein
MTQCCSAVVAVPCKLGHGQGLLLCLSLPAGDYQPLAQLPQHQLCKPASQGKELRYNGCSHAMGGCCSRHTEAEHTHAQANGCTPERIQCAQPAVSRTDTRGQQRWQLLLLQFVAVSREHTHNRMQQLGHTMVVRHPQNTQQMDQQQQQQGGTRPVHMALLLRPVSLAWDKRKLHREVAGDGLPHRTAICRQKPASHMHSHATLHWYMRNWVRWQGMLQ